MSPFESLNSIVYVYCRKARIMRSIRFSFAVCIALTGVGCASPAPSADPVEIELAKSFSRIADSMEALAQIESSSRAGEFSAQNYAYDESKIPPTWLAEITLVEDYHGDLEKFIEMVSIVGGIDPPRIDTPRSGRPVIVAIAKGKRKLISFLADSANQAGDAATIIPSFPLHKVVIKYE